MNTRVKKILLLLLAAALLWGAGRAQLSLNRERARLDLTRTTVLKDAPPLLAFTTVALGGFRGLISNFLWIRANNLQQDDKFFEAAQLADWITDLEPHFTQVWAFQAWNMAWNISVKFKSFADRWQWVQRGIELLRDRGLRYNPDDVTLYQQLAWIFQNKIGDILDDANMYYKQQWAEDMTPFFGPQGTNFVDLVHPTTAKERANVRILREKYKINPEFAEKVNQKWGPLDWRMPEAHAIYWASLGLQKARENPGKVKKKDIVTLRRVIFQSLLQAFEEGRLITDPFTHAVEFAPDLDIIPKVNDAYLIQLKEAQPVDTNTIADAQRNFLRDAVYFLYVNNRVPEAARWFKYLCDRFPNWPLLDGDTNSFPRNVTLDQYAVACVQGDINQTSQKRVTSALQGLLTHAYLSLAIGQDDRYIGYRNLAVQVYQNYNKQISVRSSNEKRVGLPHFKDLCHLVLNQLLNPRQGLPYAARAVLRTQLGMPAETNAPPAVSTNSVAPANLSSLTNAPATHLASP